MTRYFYPFLDQEQSKLTWWYVNSFIFPESYLNSRVPITMRCNPGLIAHRQLIGAVYNSLWVIGYDKAGKLLFQRF